jgi:hypothetical protein
VVRVTERYEAVTMRFLKSWDVMPLRNNLLSRVFYTWATETAKKNMKFVNNFGRENLMESCNSIDEDKNGSWRSKLM